MMTIEDLHRETGCTYRTIRKRLARAGVTPAKSDRKSAFYDADAALEAVRAGDPRRPAPTDQIAPEIMQCLEAAYTRGVADAFRWVAENHPLAAAALLRAGLPAAQAVEVGFNVAALMSMVGSTAAGFPPDSDLGGNRVAAYLSGERVQFARMARRIAAKWKGGASA